MRISDFPIPLSTIIAILLLICSPSRIILMDSFDDLRDSGWYSVTHVSFFFLAHMLGLLVFFSNL